LWTTSLLAITAITVAIALFVIGRDIRSESLGSESLTSWIVIVLVVGLALAFLVYILEKERHLRRLSHLLVEERVRSEALRSRIREISNLSEVGRALNTSLDPDTVFDRILVSALELLDADDGAVMLLNDDGSALDVARHQGTLTDRDLTRSIPLGAGLEGAVAARGEPSLVRAGKEDDIDLPTQVRSAMCVPLIRHDQLLGVLSVRKTEGNRDFDEEDLNALGFFAEHAAIAVGNARSFERERETIARLEELDRLKSDFVATVSHELRTPLTSIIGAAKTLSTRAADLSAAQHQEFMEVIERQANKLLKLAEDFLTASRLESGVPRLQRERVDLRGVAETIINDLQHIGVGKDRYVSLVTEPERPIVWGDSTSVQQILSNLVENALKYGGTDARVAVALKETESEATIEVADDGQGINQDQLQTIFERFRQAGKDDSPPGGGFGLGLFIVKNLVDAHRGEVNVASEVGKGTVFTIRLPKRASDG
jgi:signal transduction histidine kinase